MGRPPQHRAAAPGLSARLLLTALAAILGSGAAACQGDGKPAADAGGLLDRAGDSPAEALATSDSSSAIVVSDGAGPDAVPDGPDGGPGLRDGALLGDLLPPGLPGPPGCTSPMGQSCPALDDVAAACWPDLTVCSSLTTCGATTISSCSFPAGQEPYPVTPDCAQKRCVAACATGPAPTACDRCAARKCCGTLTACRADATCGGRQGALWAAFASCAAMFCPADCPAGTTPSPAPVAP